MANTSGMTNSANIIISILINLVIIGWTGYTLWWFFTVCTAGQSRSEKRKVFRYYTYNSNILSAFASGVVLITEVFQISRGSVTIPDWVILLRFIAASSVTVTMLTVVFFLAPHVGWKELYKEDGFYMHAVGPVLAIIAFSFLEKDCRITFPFSLLGASTVIIYAVIYLYKVVRKGEKAGGWPDFYGFNAKPGMWKISFPIMILLGCLVSLLLAVMHNAL